MKKKGEEPGDWLAELFDRIQEEKGTKIKSMWRVVEIQPPQRYSYGDGHGGIEYDWTETKVVEQTTWTDSYEAAVRFMEEHEPAEGNKLHIRQRSLYRRTVEEWFDGD